MSLLDVRAGIKTVLTTIQGLRVYDFQTDGPEVPAAIVGFPDTIDPHAVFGDGTDYVIPVGLLISRATDRSADTQMVELVEAIVAALDDDPTLDGACDSANVIEVANFTYGDVGTTPVMVCEVRVQVMA